MNGAVFMEYVLTGSGVAEERKGPSLLVLGSDALGELRASTQRPVGRVRGWEETNGSIGCGVGK